MSMLGWFNMVILYHLVKLGPLVLGSDHVMLRIDDKWTCSECGFSRKQKSHVREHVESVHLKLTVICPVCEREVLKSGYRVHRRVHNPH